MSNVPHPIRNYSKMYFIRVKLCHFPDVTLINHQRTLSYNVLCVVDTGGGVAGGGLFHTY